MNITDYLNNREIATIIWLSIIFLWTLTQPTVRSSIGKVLESFLAKKILLVTSCMFLYIFLMILAFERIGFWDISAIKETIVWIFGVAFVMFIHLNKAAGDESYFRKIIIDSIKFIIVLEFIINLYSFNFIAELIIVPVVILIALMSGVSSSKPEYKQVKILLDYLLGIFGIVLIIFTFYRIVTDFQNFATLNNLRDFLLPILFTIAFLPFTYMMALFIKYESVFIRIDIVNTNKDLARYAKQKIVMACHINLRKLNRLSKEAKMLRFNDKDDVSALLKNV